MIPNTIYSVRLLSLFAFAMIARSSDSALAQGCSVPELRAKLKYAFALDYVVSLPHSEYEAESLVQDSCYKLDPEDARVLEEFNYVYGYRLYRFTSYNRDSQYFLLGRFTPGLSAFFLFSGDSNNLQFLDKFELSREATFDFDTSHGGSAIRIQMETTGTGFYGRHLFLLAASGNAFVHQFHCYLATLSTTMGRDSLERSLSNLKYADLNEDGFLDIVLNTTEDYIDIDQDINPFEPGSIEQATVLAHKSTSETRFIWNPKTMTFEESS